MTTQDERVTRPLTVEEEEGFVRECAAGMVRVAHLITSAHASGTWCLLDWQQIKQHVNELIDYGLDAYEGRR